jgi:hypothetical protein
VTGIIWPFEKTRDVTQPPLLRLALPGIGVFLLVQILLTVTVWRGVPGEFYGPDSYMRLVRVLECQGGLNCPGGLLLRSNVPYGEVLHWPFLLDRLILLLALPLLPFMDLHGAVTVAGHLVGPLLGVAAMMVLTAAGRLILEDRVVRWVPLLAITHFWVIFAFAPVRPDHHGLQVLLFLAAFLGLLQILDREDRGRGSWALGVAVGLAIWVSTEGLASMGSLLGALGLVWIVRGGMDLTGALLRVWCVTTAVLGLGLCVDGPEPWRWAPDFDRFSVVHLTMFSIGAAFWALLRLRVPGRPGGRALAVFAGAALGGGLLFVLFPGIEGGPFSGIHPELVPLWLEHVSEFAPAGRLGVGPWGLMSAAPGLLGLVILGLVRAGAWGNGWKGVVPDGRGTSMGWMAVALVFFWFLALAAFGGVRWIQYLQVLAPFGMAGSLGLLLQRLTRGAAPPLLRAGGTVALTLLFLLLPPIGLGLLEGSGKGVGVAQPCSPSPLIPALAEMDGPGGRRVRVLAPVFWGPELIFRAGIDVVAGPYHRNARGMLDSYGIMAAGDPEEAHRGLRDRGIDFVAFCTTESWIPLVLGNASGTFYNDLVEDRPPSWLQRIPLMGIGEEYRLYQVNEGP